MFLIIFNPSLDLVYLKFQRRRSSFAFFLKKWKFDRRAMNNVLVLSYRIQKKSRYRLFHQVLARRAQVLNPYCFRLLACCFSKYFYVKSDSVPSLCQDIVLIGQSC